MLVHLSSSLEYKIRLSELARDSSLLYGSGCNWLAKNGKLFAVMDDNDFWVLLTSGLSVSSSMTVSGYR